MNPHKILIIEDDDFLRSLATTKIKKAGFDVEIAADGQVGLEKLTTFAPEVLLLDLMLPVVDGFQVLAAMQEYATEWSKAGEEQNDLDSYIENLEQEWK